MQKFHTKLTLTVMAGLVLTACAGGPTSQAASGQGAYAGGQGPLAARPLSERSAAGSAGSAQQGATSHNMATMHGAGQQSSTGNTQGMDHSSMAGMKGMDHSSAGAMKGMDHAAMSGSANTNNSQHGAASAHGAGGGHGAGHGAEGGHGASAAGKPGSAANAARTVNVVALDTMRFEPANLRVKAGETIRFVVTNKGKLPHEFVIGTVQEQKEHEQMMQKMPGMKHEDANAISLAPGETKTLVWQFGQSNDIQIGCHVPGHYPAGMLSKVTVASGTK